MGQTKGQLRNTEGLAKDKWHKGLVYTVSMVGAFLPRELAEAWEWKEVEWSFGIGPGLEVGRVEAVRDQGRGSCMCGERVLVLTDLVLQDAGEPGKPEVQLAGHGLWSAGTKPSPCLVSSHTRT